MSQNRFEEFRDLVLEDKSMQKELRRLLDRNEFIARVIELAREHGFEFTAAEIDEELRVGRRNITE
jgi:predicted ribosomally synthesized peptide with nif11-like leader